MLRGIFMVMLAAAVVGCGGPVREGAAPPGPVAAAPTGTAAPGAPTPRVEAFHGLGKLAYVRDGHLYILNGETDRLLEVPGTKAPGALAWSADGEWLAFRDGETGLFLADGATGRAHEIPGIPGQLGDFAWSPTGSALAVSIALYEKGPEGPATGEIWLIDDPARPQPRRLAATNTPAGALHWAPDGKRLAYAITLPYTNPESRSDVLEVIPTSGGQPERWYTAESAGLDPAGWWPDGKGILFWLRPMHCVSCAMDGRPLQSLAAGAARPLALPDTLLHRDWLSWAPDGRSLLIVRGGGRITWDMKQLATCDVTTGKCRDLPQPETAVSLDPAYAPDGSRIAFVRAARRPGQWGFGNQDELRAWVDSLTLWTSRPDGSEARQIGAAGSRIYAPAWAADSRHLLYVLDSAVWVIDADRPEPRQVAVLTAPASLFGYYGYIGWAHQVAWHRGQ